MNNTLKGYVGFKGEKGDSAYEIALQNGFVGTEQDWLSQLGTSSHFERKSKTISVTVGVQEFPLPEYYTSNSLIDIYVDGIKLDSQKFFVDTENNIVIVFQAFTEENKFIEIVTTTMSTNELPISETINANSTNETATGSKAVYDLVNTTKEETLEEVNTLNLAKMNNSDIEVITHTITSIEAGGTKITDIPYPDGFTKTNTNIIGKMVSSNNTYYDVVDLTDTTNGFPSIQMIALTDTVIRVWVKNTSTTLVRNGYLKITLLKK